jgi:hypothetical protein
MRKKIRDKTNKAVTGVSSRRALEKRRPIDIVAAQTGIKNSPRMILFGRADLTLTAVGSLSKFKSSCPSATSLLRGLTTSSAAIRRDMITADEESELKVS